MAETYHDTTCSYCNRKTKARLIRTELTHHVYECSHLNADGIPHIFTKPRGLRKVISAAKYVALLWGGGSGID